MRCDRAKVDDTCPKDAPRRPPKTFKLSKRYYESPEVTDSGPRPDENRNAPNKVTIQAESESDMTGATWWRHDGLLPSIVASNLAKRRAAAEPSAPPRPSSKRHCGAGASSPSESTWPRGATGPLVASGASLVGSIVSSDRKRPSNAESAAVSRAAEPDPKRVRAGIEDYWAISSNDAATNVWDHIGIG